ncbi:HlyD family efflux transporter periplasmic adaptor subunit [Cryptosporangium phraense]|uniref:Peptidoglycan-binding protein n=1 Tax=Cryptosporangium phraense TaxID=2593070 RepID=A0A545AQ72_9ACTN|nr:HlyD family efflux transporter periplasmic adaptor subunit [Cryptosporangium phraense]TQS43487.1 hypothetical protein FL583_19890 [Cryptosporangium phraense]
MLIDGRRRAVIAAVVTVVVLGVGAAVWAVATRPPEKTARTARAVATVAVTRADLSTGRSLKGTLGYGAPRTLKAGREGVVTWLPAAGDVVEPGETLYRVDDDRIPLFVGSPPLYRTLSAPNTVGRDVAMVVSNLKALGYHVGRQPKAGSYVPEPSPSPEPSETTDEPTADLWVRVREGDGVLTDAVIRAIEAWQHDLGLTEDGTLAVGDVVVLPGAVRVDAVSAQPGDPTGGDLMQVTRTTKVVTATAPPEDADAFAEGTTATLHLPSGTDTTGKVTAVATTIPTDDTTGDQPPQLSITLALDDPAAAGRLDAGDVDVEFAGEKRPGVLVVPVTALLALREGGYALQREDGSLIAVTTGLFSDGMVEVEGAGVAEGLKVVTTS